MSAVIQPLDDIMVIMEEPYMRKKTVGKIATALVILSLVLSGLMVLQFSARADERHEGRVEGIISTDDGIIPRGLEVNLIDLSESIVSSTETRRGGYYQFKGVDAGYYRVEFPSQSHKEQNVYFMERSGIDEVKTETTTEFDLTVERKPLEYSVEGYVRDAAEDPVEGTEITVSDLNSDYSKTVGLHNETTGEYNVKIYEGNFTITATAPDYSDIMHEVDVEEDITDFNITLTDVTDTHLVTGYLWSEDGAVNTQLRVTLIHEELGIFNKQIEEGPYFEIAAPRAGNYHLLIDSDGYLPHHQELNVENIVNIGRTSAVERSRDEIIETKMEFDENWDELTITRERTYQPDTMIQSLPYSNLGLLALQIDLAYGDGNLELDSNELQNFQDELQYIESNIPSSHRLIQVDGVSYELVDIEKFDLELPELNGESISVFNLFDEMTSTSTATYEPVEDIDVEDSHDIDLYLEQDHIVGNFRDYSYELDLPNGYERTNFPTNVDISGFTTVSIDTYEGVGRTHVGLDIQQTEQGEVNIILEEGPRVYLKEIEENDELITEYIVRQDTNVTCIADFVDPVGSEEDAEYTWYLYLDGDEDEIGTGEEINHVFTNTGERTLKVEVFETGGHITTDEVTVFVDGRAPQGVIDGDFEGNESEELTFSAYGFTDDSGEIGYYQWNFTDGSDPVEGPDMYNVTHAFDLYGTYNVKLNITDVVGNWEIYEREIVVHDVTPPVPLFNLTYQTEDEENITIHSDDLAGDRIERRYPITLDASESYDPAGFDEEVGEVESFTWWIEEDGFKHEDVVLEDYEFDDIGEYTISLNVTDEHGNYENITRTVRIALGPTPDLELSNLRVSGEKSVNEELTVSVNVTNWGERVAEDIRLEFSVDGEDVPIADMTFEKDGEETNETIDPNEMKTISFKWTPEEDGDMTLSVTIYDGEEPEELRVDNTLELDINIEPPAWRRYIVYALVPIVIIGVTVGLYFYKEKYQ